VLGDRLQLREHNLYNQHINCTDRIVPSISLKGDQPRHAGGQPSNWGVTSSQAVLQGGLDQARAVRGAMAALAMQLDRVERALEAGMSASNLWAGLHRARHNRCVMHVAHGQASSGCYQLTATVHKMGGYEVADAAIDVYGGVVLVAATGKCLLLL
jgi:hypothetical protein